MPLTEWLEELVKDDSNVAKQVQRARDVAAGLPAERAEDAERRVRLSRARPEISHARFKRLLSLEQESTTLASKVPKAATAVDGHSAEVDDSNISGSKRAARCQPRAREQARACWRRTELIACLDLASRAGAVWCRRSCSVAASPTHHPVRARARSRSQARPRQSSQMPRATRTWMTTALLPTSTDISATLI